MTGLKRLIEGVLKFRKTIRNDLVKQFEQIRDNPNPLAVLFTCMDSRILPERFVQAQVGDMFVVRNSGNMIPHSPNYGMSGYEVSVTTEPAALELAVKRGKIQHVIVCGHSDCKAINTLYNLHKCPKNFDQQSPMDHWLRKHGYNSVNKLLKLKERLAVDKSEKASEVTFSSEILNFSAYIDPEQKFAIEDKLSQINTLEQLLNISSHAFLHNFLHTGKVQLHAFWFDIYSGNLFMFSKVSKRFILVDENSAHKLLSEVEEEKLNYLKYEKKDSENV